MNSDGLYETGGGKCKMAARAARNRFIMSIVKVIGPSHPEELWTAYRDLKKTERRLRSFYLFEDYLRYKIRMADTFTEGEIQRYIRRKSLDVYAYGRIIRLIVPQWDLTRELYDETMLYDINRDLEDYEGDLPIGKPNLLYFFLVNSVGKDQLPSKNSDALMLAFETGDAQRILSRAGKILNQAFSSGKLNDHLMLRDDIVGLYQVLERKLNGSEYHGSNPGWAARLDSDGKNA